MIHAEAPTNASSAFERENKWFSDAVKKYSDKICQLQADHAMLEAGMMPEETRKAYQPHFDNDVAAILVNSRKESARYFLAQTLGQYVLELYTQKVKLNQLAFDFSRSKILVWAEVVDNDEATIDNLIMAQAKTNGQSTNKEFGISTTVVEASDGISVPPHYVPFNVFKD